MCNQLRANLNELLQEGKNRSSIKGTLLSPIILTIIVLIAVNDLIFNSYLNTKVSLFTFSIALIWIGIFNSITCICSIRAKIKVQYIQGMHISSFVFANVIYQFRRCLIQSVVSCSMFFLWGEIVCDSFPNAGVKYPLLAEYMLVILITIFSADMLGLVISAYSKDNVTAMTIMPFFLVAQMIFSNALFHLSDAFNNTLGKLTSFTVSKWSIDALGTVSNVAGMEGFIPTKAPDILFTHNWNHLLMCCVYMIGLSVFCILLAIIRLSFIKQESLF